MAYIPNYPTSGTGTTGQLRAELDAIAAELDNLLDRTDDTNNAMAVDLDMNGKAILNGNADITELTSFATVELVNQIVAGTVAQFLIPIINVSASFTPTVEENNSTWIADSASSITMTIPADSVTDFPIGSLLTLVKKGTGAVAFTNGGGAVQFISENNALTLAAPGAVASALKIAASTWLITGSLVV